jgi:hypothetical protein
MKKQANDDKGKRIPPSYVIRLNEEGYYSGNHPWHPVSRSQATVFTTMKAARKQLNRLNGRLMKGGSAEIEPEGGNVLG